MKVYAGVLSGGGGRRNYSDWLSSAVSAPTRVSSASETECPIFGVSFTVFLSVYLFCCVVWDLNVRGLQDF